MTGRGEVHFTGDQVSETDNRGASFTNVGAVFNGPVNIQGQVDNNVATYEVAKPEPVGTLALLAVSLFEKIGERNAAPVAAFSFLFGVLSIWLSLDLFMMGFGGALVLLAAALAWAWWFKQSNRCEKCNAYYSLREPEHPVVQEIAVTGGVSRTITRTLACSSCSHQEKQKFTEFIPYE